MNVLIVVNILIVMGSIICAMVWRARYVKWEKILRDKEDEKSKVYEAFQKLGLNTDRLHKNEEAFQMNPRNISMCQHKIEECGIVFLSTEAGLLKNLTESNKSPTSCVKH